ncbi:sulfate adenylyltransferase [Baekduia soli]|uniref:sulfate adenylyltransferase n=1 Tax=Baekduia soli TaxID=496014 RepID=A0A5B8U001_9ACTN|nr:GTP-binding protein [Baekduia soli]QEC46301.1 sulfate adenylyltransferase [Baekduia soli]
MSTLLRLATAGSVDDGKSTLIGRLLHDSKAILADQYADLNGRDGELDLSRLTDGLKAEREQGITIDVAYRYFATPNRDYILADTPGHVQYTRNMVTGASTADVAIVLVDARHGVVEQTKRHAFIAALLGIPHLVVAVNKMDLVGFSEEVFDGIVRDFCGFRRRLSSPDVAFIPISALNGDNVVDRSEAMPWYGGAPLLAHLEAIDPADDRNLTDLRFPVQLVIRSEGNDFRGYAGQVASGVVRPGDRVRILPSGVESVVASVETFDGPLTEAVPPQSVTVRLADDVDASRGDVIVHADGDAAAVRELEADVCWFAERPLRPGARYLLKHLTQTVDVVVDEIRDLLDVHTLDRHAPPTELGLNDIGRVRLRTRRPLVADPYASNRATGAFILIDETSNDTVAGGMVSST